MAFLCECSEKQFCATCLEPSSGGKAHLQLQSRRLYQGNWNYRGISWLLLPRLPEMFWRRVSIRPWKVHNRTYHATWKRKSSFKEKLQLWMHAHLWVTPFAWDFAMQENTLVLSSCAAYEYLNSDIWWRNKSSQTTHCPFAKATHFFSRQKCIVSCSMSAISVPMGNSKEPSPKF